MRVSRTKARRDTSAPDAFIMKWILSFTGFFQGKIIRIMLPIRYRATMENVKKLTQVFMRP